ncbi:DinB family protein [Zhihengliuella alba]|uniref:DinB family protein n=1 Tax=Zhihengliuella alba TaxID=547018 RepID=A0ABP7DHC1_9MICC
MTLEPQEPRLDTSDPAEHLVAYLDYYRRVVVAKLGGLDAAALTRARLPSGWTPLELLNHLVHMEQRWFRWGFLAESVPAPFGDHAGGAADGPWEAPPTDDARRTADELCTQLLAGGETTTRILRRNALSTHGGLGGRFPTPPAPPLLWIGFHVLQEYARHAGHLDIVRELEDGATGEPG